MNAAIDFTNGKGFDSVIITAAAPSNDPIELSSELARKKGKIIVVGAVKLDIQRDPYFFRKELELKLSCSYGPGRYDTSYEENGIDYPYAYVRWTEQRNMDAFLRLLEKKLLNIAPLITHTFEIQEAEKAYDIVMGRIEEPFIGVLLKYPSRAEKFESIIPLRTGKKGGLNIGFIGAGSFAQSYLIPYAKSFGASLNTVVTSKGITSINVANKFKFDNSSADSVDVVGNKDIDTVFIATQHNTHAKFVIEALNAGKNVFVEKPLAMNLEELKAVEVAFKKSDATLMVGFNRRFAPVCIEAKKIFKNIAEPIVLNFRINAGFIPKEHWAQNKEFGGGRIIGEMCHFIDLMQYFTDSKPVRVYADCIDGNNELLKNDDNISIVVKFDNGSIGNLTYLANGDKSVPKERLEIFGGGKTFVINDFRGGESHISNKVQKVASNGKGHKEEVEAFLTSVKNGTNQPISMESMILTTKTTFAIVDSISTGLPQVI
tara:strand:- start:78 stop:1541 length:1464 start_codon:yes stop_codon:yes gene_type:complete